MAREDVEFKVRENRLRRVAHRQGLALVKSRTLDPLAVDYGRYVLVERPVRQAAGKQPRTPWPVLVHNLPPRTWLADLDEVERVLADPKARRMVRTDVAAAVRNMSIPGPSAAQERRSEREGS